MPIGLGIGIGITIGGGGASVPGEPDVDAPTISTLSPADNAVDVLVTETSLIVTFNEPIQFGDTISIRLYETTGDVLVQEWDTEGLTLVANGDQLEMLLDEPLTAGTDYYVQITAGSIEDLAGNPFAGIANETTWNFTTASAYDAASEAIFAAFTTPPDDTRKGLINDFILALKGTDGPWAKLDALYVFAAADSQAALINWKSPGTYTATLIGSPTFTADDGFQCSLVNCINSNFTPSTAGGNYAQDSAHVSARVLSPPSLDNTARAVGNVSGTTPRISMAMYNPFSRMNNDTVQQLGSTTTAAYHQILNRSASNAIQRYENGAADGTHTQASTGLPTTAITFGGDPDGGNASNFLMASGSIGGSLTAAEAAVLATAEAAYMTAVGAI